MLKITVMIDDDTVKALELVQFPLFGGPGHLPWTYQHPGDILASAIQQNLDLTAIKSGEEFYIRRNPGTDLLELSYVGRARTSRLIVFVKRAEYFIQYVEQTVKDRVELFLKAV